VPRKLKRHAKHWAAKGLTSGEEHSKTLKSFRPSSRGPSFFANTLPADPQARAQLVKQFSAAAADTFRDPPFDPVTHAAVENFFRRCGAAKDPRAVMRRAAGGEQRFGDAQSAVATPGAWRPGGSDLAAEPASSHLGSPTAGLFEKN
jgi:hypothetical protein